MTSPSSSIREKKISKNLTSNIRSPRDARDIRDLATQVNQKIYEQDDKLDGLNKKMGAQVTEIKDANQELVKAREITSKRNKNMGCWLLFIVALLGILGGSIYFLMSKD